MRRRAFTLLELLVALALVAILVALLLPAVARAAHWAKSWAWGAFAWNENRIEAFLDDKASESKLLSYATNQPSRWYWVTLDGTNIVIR